jgi:phytol kinase
MLSPCYAILFVLAILALIFLGVSTLSKRKNLAPEIKRKTVHIGMGLTAVSFPWLFDRIWPVILLAVLAVSAMLIARFTPLLHKRIGGVLHEVERSSLGEIYFPIAIALLFVLADNEPILYVVPILVLTLADAVAALIGVRYGMLLYATSEGSKSAEGSLSFLAVAFLSAAIPLMLLTDDQVTRIILVSLVIGILVMLFEAISVGGIDNLFIPVGCYGLLQQYHYMENVELLFRLVAIGLIGGIIFCCRRKTTLIASALLAATLVGYMNWMLGGWYWLAASLVLYLTYTRIWPKSDQNSSPVHTVRTIVAVTTPGMVWLITATTHYHPVLFFSFILSYGSQLVIIGMLQLQYACPSISPMRRSATAVLRSWLVFAPIFFLPLIAREITEEQVISTFYAALTSLPLLVFTAGVFLLLDPYLSKRPQSRTRWISYAITGFAVSFLGAIAMS